MWARRELKILVGVGLATAIGYHLYKQATEDEITSLPAARRRHDLAERAIALHRKGAYYDSIQAFEELLEAERVRAMVNYNNVTNATDTIAPSFPTANDTPDVQQQVMAELGKLHRSTDNLVTALGYFKQSAARAEARGPAFAKDAGALWDRAAQAAQDQAAKLRAKALSGAGEDKAQLQSQVAKLERDAEGMYVHAVSQLLSLEDAETLFAVPVVQSGGRLEDMLEWLDTGRAADDIHTRKRQLGADLAAGGGGGRPPAAQKKKKKTVQLPLAGDPELVGLCSGVLWNLTTLYAGMGRRNDAEAACRRSLVLAKVTGSSRKDERVAVAADLLAELLTL